MNKKKTILIVEDEPSVRSTLFRKLSQKGYYVVSSPYFQEAKTFILSALKIDLAIIDIKLPDGDGMALLNLVKEQNPQAESIILTGHGTIELAFTASEQGVFQFITKPFDLNTFLEIIDRALTHKSLIEENKTLKNHIKNSSLPQSQIIGKSQELLSTLNLALRVSDSDSTILISGESGTGKELVAKLIHNNSNKANGPFIAVNCGALTEDLLESELFGHKKGSFTGAIDDRKGRFCLAQDGTLFLDEVGDMSPRLQVKLLRALQEKTYEPVGGQATLESNARIVAATHKNLEELVSQGKFREDLFYRLNVIPLNLPSLRKRKTDIPLLVYHFIEKFNSDKKRNLNGFTKEAFDCLIEYSWPGNIRELENLIERLTIIKSQGIIEVDDLPYNMRIQNSSPSSFDNFNFPKMPEKGIDFNNLVSEFENKIILQALEKTGWNKNKAAHLLNLNRTTLIEKIKKKGLTKPSEATP